MTKTFVGLSTAALLAVTAIVAVHHLSWGKDDAPVIRVENTPIHRDARLGTSFAPIIKKTAPSVVNIYSTRFIKEQYYRNPLMADPFFRQFFGDQFGGAQELTRRENWLGSGVIVSPDGYILTANHVVQGADEIKVGIPNDKTEYSARVVGTDPPTDVAVLKIDAKNLPAITLGNSDQLEVGDIVLAIGNPFGVGQTVTMGIVSALQRNLSGLAPNQGNRYQNFIQTDAAINRGNSGGALIDAEGRLIGINDAIISPSGGSSGIGFAVPINMARYVMDQLIHGGKLTRGYLGVLAQNVTAGLAEGFNLPDVTGTLVGYVEPDSPAARAGIQSGDVILSVNGHKISNAEDYKVFVSQLEPGSKATLEIFRNGASKTIVATLGEMPEPAGVSSEENNNPAPPSSTQTDALTGVTVQNLDGQFRYQLRIPNNIQGVIVVDVDSASNAAAAGLKAGDVIVGINHQPVINSDDAVRLCTSAKGDQILLKIWRRTGNFAATRFLSVNNIRQSQ